MYAPVNTTQDTSAKTENRQTASEGVTSFGFSDQRTEALQLKKLKDFSENSPQATQLQQIVDASSKRPVQKKENNTGLPDNLKSGVENLSGHSMEDVKVHYNSNKPATLQAHAYAQGTDIHIAPGQEKHLPHEAWHVAQQKQGRVKPTKQLKGLTNINDDAGLEKEADLMGAKALNASETTGNELKQMKLEDESGTAQLVTEINHTTGTVNADGEDHMVGKEMYAKLDPKDPVKGSATGVNSEWMKWIRRRYPAANVVRGHLLNHDLGGFGIEENLYPISTLANANHSSQVEQKVKGELTALDKEVSGQDEGRVHYKVKVLESNAYEQASFSCGWQITKNHQVVKGPFYQTIDSNLGTDKGGFGGGKKSQQSPPDWRHGTSKGGTEVTAVRGRLENAMKANKIAFSSTPTDHQGKNVAKADKQDSIEFLNDLVDEYGASEAWDMLFDFLSNCESKYVRIVTKLMDLLENEFTW